MCNRPQNKSVNIHCLFCLPKVRKLLKQFMLDNVVPQLQKEGEGKSCFIQDPMRAAVVMLYVWKKFGLKLDHGESTRLCSALCLPKLPKDSFLQYWTDFAQAVSGLKKWVLASGFLLIFCLLQT